MLADPAELAQALEQAILAADKLAEALGFIVAECTDGGVLEIEESGILGGRNMLLGWARIRAHLTVIASDDGE